MVLDTSALVAMLFHEPERDAMLRALHAAPQRTVSAGTLLEAGMVVEGRAGIDAGIALDAFLARIDAEIVAVDEQQSRLARNGWRRFGKGNHPAGLNFGDCFAYALARATDAPLLFKGDDFARTDVLAAPY